jgi:glycosyltransferase involved in cell wall biosynthesis
MVWLLLSIVLPLPLWIYGAYDGVVNPRVTIISSVYNGDSFIEGFMQDITQQTIFHECELLLINANSPGNEESVIKEYMYRYPNIRYLKLDHDPGLYAVWNIGIKNARAPYITNANIDDRLAHNCYEIHADELDRCLEVDLVYSDQYRSSSPNITFSEAQERNELVLKHAEFSKSAMRECLPNNHPMWRKILHEKCGYFDESYKSAGDWEMWLRAVEHGSVFKKINGVYAVFYWNSTGLSHLSTHASEVDRIKDTYKNFLHANSNGDQFYLITTLYNEKDQERIDEYKLCLERNLQNKNIKEVWILYDISRDDDNNEFYYYLAMLDRVKMIRIEGRPSYNEIFSIANRFTEKFIIANADVFFDATLQNLERINFNEKIVLLTRWNLSRAGTTELQTYISGASEICPCYMSYDALIFRTPLKVSQRNNILFGTWMCDSLIALNMLKDNFKVVNPCLDVILTHVHMSEKRNYEQVYVTDGYECPDIPWTTIDDYAEKNKHRVAVAMHVNGDDPNLHSFLMSLTKDPLFGFIDLHIYQYGKKTIEDAFLEHSNVFYSFYQNDPGLPFILNKTINDARAEYLGLIRSDCLYADSWFELLARALDRDTSADLIYGAFFETSIVSNNFFDATLQSKRCIVGFDPSDLKVPFVWRKSIHTSLGYFNDDGMEQSYNNFWSYALTQGLKTKNYEKILIAYRQKEVKTEQEATPVQESKELCLEQKKNCFKKVRRKHRYLPAI